MGLFEEFDSVTYQDWKNQINLDLKGKDFQETLVWISNEGIDVQPFYNSDSLSKNTPSITPPIKKSANWKIQEKIIINSFEDANKKALLALNGGASSLLFVGGINNQNEMDILLDNIQTESVEIHLYNSKPKDTSGLTTIKKGSISFDYLGEYLVTGNWKNSKESAINELAEITSLNNNLKTITVNSIKNTSSIVQELAFSLAQAVEYFNLLTDKGIDANTIASKIQFTFGVGTNYFFEIAKIRAARKLWALILEQFKVTDSSMIILSETSLSNLTDEDKNYNLLRNTTKAMSAIIGGCDSLTVFPHDTTESTIDFSNRTARNIQHILKEESFFDKVNNPADGSYYVEQLTDKIANKTWQLFQKIETKGGFLESIKNGFIKNELNA